MELSKARSSEINLVAKYKLGDAYLCRKDLLDWTFPILTERRRQFVGKYVESLRSLNHPVTLDEKLREIPSRPRVFIQDSAARSYISEGQEPAESRPFVFQAGRTGVISYEIKTAELVGKLPNVRS